MSFQRIQNQKLGLSEATTLPLTPLKLQLGTNSQFPDWEPNYTFPQKGTPDAYSFYSSFGSSPAS